MILVAYLTNPFKARGFFHPGRCSRALFVLHIRFFGRVS